MSVQLSTQLSTQVFSQVFAPSAAQPHPQRASAVRADGRKSLWARLVARFAC